jgi:hypothetical protein
VLDVAVVVDLLRLGEVVRVEVGRDDVDPDVLALLDVVVLVAVLDVQVVLGAASGAVDGGLETEGLLDVMLRGQGRWVSSIGGRGELERRTRRVASSAKAVCLCAASVSSLRFFCCSGLK